MSAFIVGHDHIDALVSFAILKRISYWDGDQKKRIDITHTNATEVGRILLSENTSSVACRYMDRLDEEERAVTETYTFRLWSPVPMTHIMKACNCLDYQCCETDDWEQTVACRIVDEIRQGAINSLPGYTDAPWELLRPADAPKQVLSPSLTR